MAARDPRIDAYIAKSAEFARPILTHLREVVHAACPDVEETLKWSMPSFMYAGSILCGMAAFKQHATFGFWKSRLIVPDDGASNAPAMGQFGRIVKLSDLPSKKTLTGYIKQAMKLDAEGVKDPARVRTAKPRSAPATPDDLLAALKKNKQAKAMFDAFSASCKREYVEWITEANPSEGLHGKNSARPSNASNVTKPEFSCGIVTPTITKITIHLPHAQHAARKVNSLMTVFSLFHGLSLLFEPL